MASSLLGLALGVGFASAQIPDSRPVPLTYDVKVSPWPQMPKSAGSASAFMVPGAAFAAPVPPVRPETPKLPTPPGQAAATPSNSSPKTLYYRKDMNAPVRPWAAAELTKPIAAQATSNPMPPSSTGVPSTRGDESQAKKLLPNPETMFSLDGERGFVQRENQRRAAEDATLPAEKRRKPIEFPELAAVPGSEGAFMARVFPQQTSLIEPNYVCYRRLFFEDRNAERYGWSLGPLQPIASGLKFLGDWMISPYRFGSQPFARYECSAGLCLPGDHVPYMIYPPGLSITGAGVEAGVALMLLFTIP